MPTSESQADELHRLRNTMRDLVALSTLPAVWAGYAPEGVAKSLAEILLNTLSLELVYVQVRGAGLGDDLEIVRGKGLAAEAGQARAVAQALAPWLTPGASEPPPTVRDPLGHENLRVAVARFGHGGDGGVMVACSRRSDFPTEDERLLLSVGTNQTAVVLQRKRAQRSLAEERERLRITLSSIGDAVISTEVEGRVTFMNGVAESLTGWAQAEAVGRPLPEVFHIVNEQTRQPVENPALRALREGMVVGLANHTILVARDGTTRPIDDSAAPMRNESGASLGAVLVFRDVTERKRAEAENQRLQAEMEVERARLAEVFQRAPTFMCVRLGPDHVFERANDRYYELLGRRDIIGKPVREAVPEAEGQGFFEILDHVYQSGEPFVGKNMRIVLRRGGQLEERTLEFVYQPIRDGEGAVSGILAHGIDLTERVRAEEELARLTAESERQRRMYETALSNTVDFNYLFDRQGRFTFVNKALLTLWGKDLAGAVGKTFLELDYPRDLAARLQGQIQQVIDTERPLKDETPYTSDSGARAYEYIFVPVFGADGSVEAVAGSTRDITERKAMEESLREADRKKDEFIALLAHELRNPLAPIRTGLEIMRLAGGDVAAAVTEAHSVMDRQIGHMVRLIDDLLDVSRINRGKMELRRARVALADVVNAAVETSRPVLDAERHAMNVSLPRQPVFLDADLARLAQVFSNLLTNSAKYTERGGRIWLTAEQRGGDVVVSVRDTGIGIPAESLGNVFDMFSQVDRSIERSTGGLGIGLALVKRLVEMHGGTVNAASEGQGRGSTFTVTLPAVESPIEADFAAPSENGRPEPGPGRRVLVVDDNRDGADSLAMMLRLMSNEVRTAHDGIEALAQAEAFRPEIVLMDVGMPRLNGLDAVRRIREEPWGKAMLIIALTGWGQDGDKERSRQAGCDGHLVKPVNPPDLEKWLANAPEARA